MKWLKNITKMTNKTQKISFIGYITYKIGQKSNIK